MKLPKLSKAQIKQSLEMTPAHVVLAGNRKLTAKQRAFAKNLVEGMNQTEAYSQAYKHKGKRKTMSDNASRLAKDSRIQAEVDALERAKQFSELYSTAQLRTLVISQLTKEAVNPESKASERIAALGKLGQVAELGVFVQRTETKVIKDSDTAKHDLMEQLKRALGEQMRTVNEDDTDELDLLAEITAPAKRIPVSETPPEGDPHLGENDGSHILHSNVDKRLDSKSSLDSKTAFQASNQGQLATLPDEMGTPVPKSHPDWEELHTGNDPLTVSKQKG
jgi:phage terminase small subunit